MSASKGKKQKSKALKDGDKDYETPCLNCQDDPKVNPTVHPTELCGPCCFGEAATYGGNW